MFRSIRESFELWCVVSRRAVPFGAVLAVVTFGLSPSAIAQAAGAGTPPQEPAQEMKPAPEVTRAPEMINSQAINEARPIPNAVEMESWRRRILKVPTKKEGCFTANFPDAEWKEIPCKEPPHKLYLPRRPGNVRTEQVGGSSRIDFSAVGNGPIAGSTGPITEAEGSFDSSNATSECNVQCPGQVCPVAPSCTGQPSNAFTLQLNTKPFANTALCLSLPEPEHLRGVGAVCLCPGPELHRMHRKRIYPVLAGRIRSGWLDLSIPRGIDGGVQC